MKTRTVVFIFLGFLALLLVSGIIITCFQNTFENIIISISTTLSIIILVFSILGFENIHKYYLETFFYSYTDDVKTIMSYLNGVYGDYESMRLHYERFNEFDYYGNEAFYYGNLLFVKYSRSDALNKIEILRSLTKRNDINSITKGIILLNILKIGSIVNKNGDKYSFDNELISSFKTLRKDCPYYYKIMIENDQMKEDIKRLTNFIT